jgi:sterol desaturase/sphingolipid hydroxylase (fatty acid hydroxylase superfamily)
MQYLAHFTVDVLRLTMWLAVLALVFVPLERLFALRPAKAWRAGIVNDLGYYFLSSLLPAAALALPMALLATALQRLMPAGWLDWAAALPFWARFALALVVAEFGTYWGHRWSHEVPFLWRFHALHHSPEHMDWLVNSRAHPVDMVFVRLCGLVPLYVFGLARPAGGGTDFAIVTALLTTFWGFLIHANLRWRFGPIEQLLATPAFHHWHHTRTEHINRNYAAMFPWMDRLFGTLYLPRREWPAAYGIDTPMADGLGSQLIEPLTKTRALAKES